MPNVKGTVLIEMLKPLRAERDRAAGMLAPNLHRYLDETIVVASWYPLDEYISLLRAAGRMMPADAGNPFEQLGRLAAKAHMSGMYSRLKDNSSRQASFTLLSSMYDSGELAVVEREPGRAVLELRRFAVPSREICGTITGYQAERMDLQGFEDVSVRHTKCRGEKAPSCLWEIAWKGRKTL